VIWIVSSTTATWMMKTSVWASTHFSTPQCSGGEYLDVKGSGPLSTEHWKSFAKNVAVTTRLKSFRYGWDPSWLASVSQSYAPVLDKIDIENWENARNTLPNLPVAFSNIFENVQYANLAGYLPEKDDTVNWIMAYPHLNSLPRAIDAPQQHAAPLTKWEKPK
jgi:hypothetical protein